MSGEDKITVETLKRYVELEKEIRHLENKNIRKGYNAIKRQLDDVTETIKTLEDHFKKCQAQTEKEKADVDKLDVKAFVDQTAYETQYTKEQAEYLEALNKEEVIKKQLEGIKQQKNDMEKELKSGEETVKKLDALEEEQDKLLSSIFKGEYGSDLENKLEADYDLYQEKKQRIGVAKYKWTNGRVLLQHACNQLGFASKRWMDSKNISMSQMQQKYQVVTEARNNLIAAIQNLRNCQRYLDNIEFPYCKKSEIDTLEKATNNIYVDMRSNDRHQHAYNCYHVTHRRAAALLQWFNNVINTVIEKDMKDATKLEAETGKALREERLKLLREKLEEKGEKVEDVPEKADEFDDTFEPELMGLAKLDVQETEGLKPGEESLPAPTPIPLRDLAPPPSQEDMFGNIEQLKKQHEKEMTDFQKAQEMNKARLQQGLEEKLAARRNKRQRQTPAPQ